MQTGFRRMNPTSPLPRSLEDGSPPPFRFTEYFEKYGGFGAYMVAQIADLLMTGQVELPRLALPPAGEPRTGLHAVALPRSAGAAFPKPARFTTPGSKHGPRSVPPDWATVEGVPKRGRRNPAETARGSCPGGRRQDGEEGAVGLGTGLGAPACGSSSSLPRTLRSLKPCTPARFFGLGSVLRLAAHVSV